MSTSKRQETQLDPKKLKAVIRRLDEQLTQVRANAALLEERDSKFVELESLLDELPEKISHPVMVPFGPLAFFEGHLEHTNEVLVQLSSDWFALKTAKHALGTVARRRQRLRSELEGVGKDLQELQARKRLARSECAAAGGYSESEGLLDIREPVDELEEDTERAKMSGIRGATVTRDADGYLDIREPLGEESGLHGEEVKRCTMSGSRGATVSRDANGYFDIREPFSDDDDDLPNSQTTASCSWASLHQRLQELELLEDEGHTSEIPEAPEGGDARVCQGSDSPWNLARLAELEKEEEMDELEELDQLIDSYERTGGPPSVLAESLPKPAETCVSSERSSETKAHSPADLYQLMSGIETCTNTSSSSSAQAEVSKDRSFIPPVRTVSEQAFSGEIRENIVPCSLPAVGTSDVQPAASDVKPQRVSKFKADRQRSNH